MDVHLRYSGADPATQAAALIEIVEVAPLLREALTRLRGLALPDGWIVSGAIYNTVWNALTGRPLTTGIKDVDIFYWDDSDLSYEAEDAIIRRAAPVFADLPVPVEIRNQARVHLWYEGHFGAPCAPILSSREAIDRFASVTHSVGARRDAAGAVEIYAPYGLDDLFSFRIVPNRLMDNARTHEAKGARAKSVWPEITVVPWEGAAAAGASQVH